MTEEQMQRERDDVRVETQAGTADRQIMQRAAPEVAEVFASLMERLNAILRETGPSTSRRGAPRRHYDSHHFRATKSVTRAARRLLWSGDRRWLQSSIPCPSDGR